MHKIGGLIGSTTLTLISARGYHEEALDYQRQGNLNMAQSSYIRALNAADQAYRINLAKVDVSRTLARIHCDYAGLLEKLRHDVDAEEAYQQAQKYGQQACELKPDHAESQALLEKIERQYKQFHYAQEKNTQAYQGRKAVAPSTQLNWLQAALSVQRPSVASSIQEKSALLDDLFERALSMLAALRTPNKPSLFLVYAHNNPAYGRAEADTARYFIKKLSQLWVNLYSDQTPVGQPYSALQSEQKHDGRLEDILTSQLCLLPTQLIDGVTPVDKVIVCCSEVLGNYLAWPDYQKFCQALRVAYATDQATYRTDSTQAHASAIREVVRNFSQEVGFHHVLTEMAFLQIREERLKYRHGIIPIPLTPKSHTSCLSQIIQETVVRIGDIPQLEAQAQTGKQVYANQSRHNVLFKVIERLLSGSDNKARTLLDKFWQGHRDLIARLNDEALILSTSELDELVENIFKDFYTVLNNQLAHAVLENQRTQSQSLQASANPLAILGDNIEQFKQNYAAYLQNSGEIRDALEMYVPLHGLNKATDKASFDLAAHIERFLQSDDKTVLLLLGSAGSGKSTFNRHLARQKLAAHQSMTNGNAATPLVFFIELRNLDLDKPNQNAISTYLHEEGFTDLDIRLLQKHQRCLFIFDGYDEIQERNRHFYTQNKLWQWQNAKFIITSRPEYLEQGYRQYFHPKGFPQHLQETWIAPFSAESRAAYIDKYAKRNARQTNGWNTSRYQTELAKLSALQEQLNRPIVLRMILSILPSLKTQSQESDLTLSTVYEAYFEQWWARWQLRIEEIALTKAETDAKDEMAMQGGFIFYGLEYSQQCAIALTKIGRTVAENNPTFAEQYQDVHPLFFGKSPHARLLRFNAPLSRNPKGDYQFPHKSMQEYFVARAICAPKFKAINPHPADTLNQLSLVNEPVILDFLVEQVKAQPLFKAYLHAWIETSKKPDALVTVGAANAITVLVRAGVQFNSANLRAIRIPNADLSYGVFDFAQLQRADLSKTNLTGIWLRHANLTGARMDGVQFGELPSLQLDDSVEACCYSSDGRYLAAATSNWKIALYDAKTLAHLHTFEGHTRQVTSVALSPDGQTLISGSDDKTVRLWSVAEKKPLHTFEGHTDSVTSVALLPDGQTLASGSGDNTVRLWSVAEQKPLHTFEGHTREVTSVALSPDGQTLASGSRDNTVRLWSVAEKKPLHTFEGHTFPVTSVALLPDGQTLASGSHDATVRLWSVAEQKPLHTFEGHTDSVTSVALLPDGQTLASGSRDNTVRLWSVAEQKLLYAFEGHTHWVTSVALSPDGQTLASGSWDKTVRLWSVVEKKSLHTFEGHTHWVTSVALSPDGQTLASGSDDNTVRLWSVAEKKPLHTFEGHPNWVTSVALSPDGQTLASGSWGNTVRLWLVAEKRPLHTFKGHTHCVTSVALSADGQTLASGSRDNTVRLWPVAEQKPLHAFKGHTDWVTSVALSPDGQTLASGSHDKTVRLWSVGKKKPLHTFEGHTHWVTSVALSHDGQMLASGSGDNTVRLWSVAEQKPLHTFEGHTREVTSVALSPDGQTLASGSGDRTVRLWSVTSGQCLTVIQGFNGNVNSVAWQATAEGVWLWTGGNDKAIRCWQVHREGEACRVTLCWASAQTTLTAPDMCIQDVIGLSPLNTQLLKQRGAMGEPRKAKKQETRSLLTERA